MKRKMIILLAALCFALTGNAQKKTIEHNFYLGVGVANMMEGGVYYASCVGYGLNYYLSPHWSVMPGVGYRGRFGNPFASAMIGKEYYDCSFLDVPVLVQYHQHASEENGWVAELGPVFSILASNDYHYVDADPTDELNGKKVYRNFDFGIQPGIYYQVGKHWRFGVQAHVGFLNIVKKYPNMSETLYTHDVMATVNFHF